MSFLAKGGADMARLEAMAGLRPGLMDDPESLLPLNWAGDFLDDVGRREGIVGFGARVGAEARIDRMGCFGGLLANSLTLKQLLDRLRKLVPLANSGAKVWLTRDQANVSLHLQHRMSSGRAEADGFALLILIDAVRMALGPEWRPRRFTLDSDAGDLAELEALSGGRRLGESSHVSLEIPAFELHRAILRERFQDTAPMNSPPRDLIASLEAGVEAGLGRPVPTIEGAAVMANMSRRSLQRHLALNQTSYREVVDRLRHRHAIRLLGEMDVPVVEISEFLGYSNPANFTHAFRRWTDLSPIEYRRRLGEGLIR
ncbi:helix-turn-helix domain-containing protein [Haloferula rosea]|uniref:Helix-turn-helix domain-containing protein n=2 Tax=Haloferula rosea TaxID=490093 RepID=A0A934R7P2_9BACT|nr:helix-turn-helix domain-containing protein [Haloferula rosea]